MSRVASHRLVVPALALIAALARPSAAAPDAPPGTEELQVGKSAAPAPLPPPPLPPIVTAPAAPAQAAQPSPQPQPAPAPSAPAPAQPQPAPAPQAPIAQPQVARPPAAQAPPAPPAAPPPLVQAPATQGPAAPAPAAAALEGAVTVKESVLPGSEPRTPGTLDNGFDSPQNLRVAAGANGATGLWRTSSADLGPPGVLRISLGVDWFSGSDFPVAKQQDTRTAGLLSAGYTFSNLLEAYLAFGIVSNTNSASNPQLLQTLGNTTLGVKASVRLGQGLLLGADVSATAYPGVDSVAASKYAFGVAPKLLATFDARQLSRWTPLRLHVNVGAVLDNTSGLITTPSYVPTPAETFAIGMQQYNRLSFGLGLEAPLPWVTPFVEWSFAYPLVASDFVLKNPSGVPVSASSAMQDTLGLGLRVTAIGNLSLLVACEFGLASNVAAGVPATPPFNLAFGLSWALEPFAKPPTKVIERTVDRTVEKKVPVAPPPTTGKLGGKVVDAVTGEPVGGAVIALSAPGLPPVASDLSTGAFLTHEAPPGRLTLSLSRAGYRPATVEGTVAAGAVTQVQARLVPEPKDSPVQVALFSGKEKLSGWASFTGPKAAHVQVGPDGATVELPKGQYQVRFDADGHLSRGAELEVAEATPASLRGELAVRPRESQVVLQGNHLLLKKQVRFDDQTGALLPEGEALLDQVADLVFSAGIKKLRVAGHTDKKTDPGAAKELSQKRADAVADHLARRGIPRAALVAEGLGDAEPTLPNVTAWIRQLNRRIELIVVEK